MPTTRSTKKDDTGKAGAPKTPAKATLKATSRATPRSKAKPATKASAASDLPASSSSVKTRSRAPRASAALTQHATSSDPPSSSPTKTRGSKRQATNVPVQSMSSSVPPPSSPANTRSGKRKAAAALEQTAASSPVKTRRQSARVASRASTEEPVDDVPISEDTFQAKTDVGISGQVSQTEGQDTDSSLSTIDSEVFDEGSQNKVSEEKPEVEDVPMVDAGPEPNTPTIVAAANVVSAKPALQDMNNNTTTATEKDQKSELVAAPVLKGYTDPQTSTTTNTVAQVPNLASAVQANKDATGDTAGSQKPHAEAQTLETVTESGASLRTTATDTKGPDSSHKASGSAKTSSSGGRKSRAKASTSKATTKSTVSTKAATSVNTLDPVPSPQVGSSSNAITLEVQSSLAKDTTSRVDSTTTTAAEAPNQTPAPVSTDNAATGAEGFKSPSKDESRRGTLKTSEVGVDEPEQINIAKNDSGAAVVEHHLTETVVTPGKNLCGQEALAGEETVTCMSDSGANITPAPVSGNSPQHKDVPEPDVITAAVTPSPRLPLATSSISPLSGAVNPYPPITPNAISETGSNGLIENESRQALHSGSPVVPEDLVLTGQSFKVLWPVYQDMRKLIELKDEQGKEVVDDERKLLWKLYEQCRKLKNELDEHEKRKSERKKI